MSNGERLFQISQVVFEFIRYIQKYKYKFVKLV